MEYHIYVINIIGQILEIFKLIMLETFVSQFIEVSDMEKSSGGD